MTAPKVRADYDQLRQSAQQFGGQAQAAQKSLQTLQRDLDVLQGGDWVGVGATAFYQEMNSQVLPTMKRLTNALQSAQQTTLQIQKIVQEAEAEAARWLRGDGGGAAGGVAGLAAGVVAGPGSGSGSGGAGGGGGAGGAAGTATPAQVAQVFKAVSDATEKIGAALGMGDALAVAFAKGVEAGLAGAPADMKTAIMQVLEEGSVDRKLSGFSQGTRDMVNQSPTLRNQVFQAEQKGYNFKTGALADGYYTDPDTKTIVIDQPLGDATTVSHIAHEVGHAVTLQTNLIQPTATTTRDQFVQQNVNNLMQNEGEAQFNAAQIRAEIKAANGTDIGIPGSQTADYQAAYDDFAAGKITKAQAVARMSTLMGNETVSTPPYQRYRDSYADAYRKHWDDNIAPTRPKP